MEYKPKLKDRDSDYVSRDEMESLIFADKPLVLDEFEGKVFMRGSCGGKPCKGHYQ